MRRAMDEVNRPSKMKILQLQKNEKTATAVHMRDTKTRFRVLNKESLRPWHRCTAIWSRVFGTRFWPRTGVHIFGHCSNTTSYQCWNRGRSLFRPVRRALGARGGGAWPVQNVTKKRGGLLAENTSLQLKPVAPFFWFSGGII